MNGGRMWAVTMIVNEEKNKNELFFYEMQEEKKNRFSFD